MAQNTSPVFVLIPLTPTATIAAANTARDGSGSLVTLFTCGANGGRIESIKFTSAQATAAASSAMVGRVFVSDAAGANPRLHTEIAIATATASTTVIGATSTITFPGGLPLKTGQIVYVTQSVYAGAQDQMHVTAQAGDY
jgi:hypothetical protein